MPDLPSLKQVSAERFVDLNPFDRYAVVGKSRSGKTSFATALSCRIIPYDYRMSNGWECWWVDTKNDRRDINRLHRWGFKDGYKNDSPRKLIIVPFEEGKPMATVDHVNAICYRAMKQHGVLLVIDEYRHCVPTTRTASPGILHVHQRGAGRDVGMIGLTQEPVEIPRQLISQAAHVFLFNLTYPRDIKYAREIHSKYRPPKDAFKHDHGFYHGWIDGDGEWRYYEHQRQWAEQFTPLTAPT